MLAFAMVLLLVIALVLSIPQVQTQTAQWLVKKLETQYGIKVGVSHLRIRPVQGAIDAGEVLVFDQLNDTLFYAQRLSVSGIDLMGWVNGQQRMGHVLVSDFLLDIQYHPGDSLHTLNRFLAKLPQSKDTTQVGFFGALMSLKEGQLRVGDQGLSEPARPMVIDIHSIEAAGLQVASGVFNTEIQSLSADLDRWANIQSLSGQLTVNNEQISLNKLVVRTPRSSFEGSVSVDDPKTANVSFVDRVNWHMDAEAVTLDTDELNVWADFFGRNQTIEGKFTLDGMLQDLTVELDYLNSGATGLRASLRLQDLFSREKTGVLDAQITNLETEIPALKSLFPRWFPRQTPESLARFGMISTRGSIHWEGALLNTKMNASTALGAFYTDVTIKGVDQMSTAQYSGYLSLIEFDLGAYALGNNSFEKTTADAQIGGTGFTWGTLNTFAEGLIYETTLNGYTYRDIELSGQFKNQRFEGLLSVMDPNCSFTFSGLADLGGERNQFDFEAEVTYADLFQMNLVKDATAQLSGKVVFDLQGNDVDDVDGTISFNQAQYKNSVDTFNFENFEVVAQKDATDQRSISINSPDIVTGQIKGKFKLKEFGEVVRNALGGIYENFVPLKVTPGQKFDFRFKLYNTLIEAFLPDFSLGQNTELSGRIDTDQSLFKLDVKSPSMRAYAYSLDSVLLQVDTKNPLFKSYVSIASIGKSGGLYPIKQLEMINNTRKDTLFFRAEFTGGQDSSDKYALDFFHTFLKGNSSVVGVKNLQAQVRDMGWRLGSTSVSDHQVMIQHDLSSVLLNPTSVISEDGGMIKASGSWLNSQIEELNFTLDQVPLRYITPPLENLQLDGMADGSVKIQRKDNRTFPAASLNIQDFSVNETVFGPLSTDVLGNEDLSEFLVNGHIGDQKNEQLRILGKVISRQDSTALDLLASFNGFDVAPFSPLGKDIIHRIKGRLFGNAKITGLIDKPQIDGSLSWSNGGLGIPYLGVVYDFAPSETLLLKGQEFVFQNFSLIDPLYKSKALLRGEISHSAFKDWKLNLFVESPNSRFLLLNTQAAPEQLYYGLGFFKGNGRIWGPTQQLSISLKGSTGEQTSIKIPVSDVVYTGSYDFITFNERNEGVEQDQVSTQAVYQGLQLDFDFDLTPEAEIEVVIDPQTGSSLKGRGTGNILMDINTTGGFRMFGDYRVNSGTYNYKFGGFIDKTFKVKPGGTIVWEGDPMQAQLNVEAAYNLYANPAPLVRNSGYNQRIPTEVLIRLLGPLERPNIDFDIAFPGTNSVIQSELNYALQDPTVQDRNAFFLLAQGSFVNNELAITEQAVTGNLLQSASGFLSQMISGGSDRLNLGISYEQGYTDRNANITMDNRIGVSLSTQITDRVLFNGRLGVPVGGRVADPSLAGDAEVQFLLNESGSLSAKIFNRENQFQQLFALRQGYTQGLGLSYQVSFDSWRVLMNQIFGHK